VDAARTPVSHKSRNGDDAQAAGVEHFVYSWRCAV